ncbi:hypothetical protein D3C86_1692910 [compost metagenome]
MIESRTSNVSRMHSVRHHAVGVVVLLVLVERAVIHIFAVTIHVGVRAMLIHGDFITRSALVT